MWHKRAQMGSLSRVIYWGDLHNAKTLWVSQHLRNWCDRVPLVYILILQRICLYTVILIKYFLRSPPYLGVDAVSALSATDIHNLHVHGDHPLPRSALQLPRAVRWSCLQRHWGHHRFYTRHCDHKGNHEQSGLELCNDRYDLPFKYLALSLFNLSYVVFSTVIHSGSPVSLVSRENSPQILHSHKYFFSSI